MSDSRIEKILSGTYDGEPLSRVEAILMGEFDSEPQSRIEALLIESGGGSGDNVEFATDAEVEAVMNGIFGGA